MISIRKIKKNDLKGPAFGALAPKHGIFQLSQKVDYGLFLLIELAKAGSKEPLSLRNIAENNRMSFFFMQKVANDLRNASLITSTRGKLGGYVLAKSSRAITLKDILEALEGPVAVMHCLTHEVGTQSCVRENSCTVRPGLTAINQILLKALTKTTLENLITSSWKKTV